MARRFFKWLKRMKWVSSNPFLEIEAITVSKDEKARSIVPTMDILQQLLAANYEHRFEFLLKSLFMDFLEQELEKKNSFL